MGGVLLESGAQARDMTVRAIRYLAMATVAGLSDFSESETGELSDEMFILGIDRLVETILKFA